MRKNPGETITEEERARLRVTIFLREGIPSLFLAWLRCLRLALGCSIAFDVLLDRFAR